MLIILQMITIRNIDFMRYFYTSVHFLLFKYSYLHESHLGLQVVFQADLAD